MNMESAVEKVKKLLALSQRNNSAEEAASAAKAAQVLMDKHGITNAMLDENGDQDDEDISKNHEPLDRNHRMPQWRKSLANAIASVNACSIYYGTGYRSTSIKIIGRNSDVDKVRYLYQYLAREIDMLTKKHGSGNGRIWNNNFRLGCVDTIRQKLHEAKEQAKHEMYQAAAGDTQALIRLDNAITKLSEKMAKTKQWESDNMKYKTSRSNSYHYDANGRMSGRKAGEGIRIGSARGSLGSGQRKLTN